MTPEEFERVCSAFEAALDLAGSERDAYLQRALSNDEALVGEARRMLDAHTSSGSFLEPPTNTAVGDVALRDTVARSSEPGTRIADFVLERLIGAGGTGEVWAARQIRPERTVALKLQRIGLETDRARRRFEDESELLARLSHPGIARVLASGVIESEGVAPRPWFAMELVEGARTITAFGRDKRLVEKLELLREACDAVHHGHLRGVIHRDLKPENVLVDEQGRVRVIDFGIARVTESNEAESSLTSGGELIGTLRYMSPEQVQGRRELIDLRTDVHALGVLLYELLVGRCPWTEPNSPWTALATEIREVDPTPPSRLASGVSKELDWIVAKALAKEPEQRYSTASELSDELTRFLRNEPLRAGPPSVKYLVAKFARRNRWLVLAAGIFVLGSFGTGWFLYKSLLRGRQLEAATLRAELATERAEERAERADTISEFIQSILRSSNQLHASGLPGQTTVSEMLDRAAQGVSVGFEGRPDLEADLRLLIGISQHAQGQFESAVAQLRLARSLLQGLQPERIYELVKTERKLAVSLARSGAVQEGLEILRAAHAAGYASLDDDHPELGALDSDLAWILQEVGEFEESVSLARNAIVRLSDAGPDFVPVIAAATSVVARGLRRTGRTKEAAEAYRSAHALQVKAYGTDSYAAAVCASNLGAFHYAQGEAEEARHWFEEALRVQREVLGPTHPILGTTLYNLSAALQDVGELDAAESFALECIEQFESTLGAGHPETADARFGLALICYAQDRFEEAATGLDAFASFMESRHGPSNPRAIKARIRACDARVRADGDGPAAEELEAYYQALHEEHGPGHDLTRFAADAGVRAFGDSDPLWQARARSAR